MKRNKTFVTSMIITSIVGFTVLLIVMFIGIKYFVKETVIPIEPPTPNTVSEDEAFYITSIGVVKEISEEQITFLDTQKKEIVIHKIKPTTKVLDRNENTLPLSEIKVGEVVDIVYQPEKENLVCIRLTADAFKKTDITNLKIDRSNRSIGVGNKVYRYTGQTFVFNDKGETISMHDVSEYDKLELIGIGDNIYTVKVLERAGYLKLKDLPSYEGMLEIDVNRQIPLNEQVSTIALSAGEHQVTIRMEDYEPISTTLKIESGKTLEYIPEGFERKQTILAIQVMNTDSYEIKVGDVTYNKGDMIKVPTGTYNIQIRAEGFKEWQQELNLQDPNMLLQVTLVSIGEETSSTEGATNQDVNINTDTNTGSGDRLDYSINISSEPSDAKVYINGESKGITPYKTKLPVGEYSIILKKEGYKDYETNILIDQSDDQNSYLYMLIPE